MITSIVNIIKMTKLTCIALGAFLTFPLTKWWLLVFFNLKNYLFVKGKVKNASKAMHVSFVLIKIDAFINLYTCV
jgi:hypothetical protein